MHHPQKFCFFLPRLCWVSPNLPMLPPFCFYLSENFNFMKPFIFFFGEGREQREKWLVALECSSFPATSSIPEQGHGSCRSNLAEFLFLCGGKWEKSCANPHFSHIKTRHWMFPCGMGEFFGVSMMEDAGLGCSSLWGL